LKKINFGILLLIIPVLLVSTAPAAAALSIKEAEKLIRSQFQYQKNRSLSIGKHIYSYTGYDHTAEFNTIRFGGNIR
jgi:hypothetical protein